MHPIEGVWREVIDREAEPALLVELEAHLQDCAECQRTLATIRAQRDQVAGLLERLGGPVPARSATQILDRVSRRGLRRRMLIAATIAFCLATAAGATVRAGLFGPVNEFLHTRRSPTSTIAPAPQSDAGVPTSSGVELIPPSRLEVVFDEWQGRGEIVIVVSSEPKFSISASAPQDYSVRRGRVTVTNRGGTASYRIILPLSVVDASIRIADQEVFSKQAATIHTQARAEGAGSYVLPFSPRERTLP